MKGNGVFFKFQVTIRYGGSELAYIGFYRLLGRVKLSSHLSVIKKDSKILNVECVHLCLNMKRRSHLRTCVKSSAVLY